MRILLLNSLLQDMVEMVNIYDYIDLMRVKVADLKAHLSRHLRHVQETGETLQVCVRENPVAYLTPAGAAAPDAAELKATDVLRERLRSAGLRLAEPISRTRALPVIQAATAGDGRTDLATVAALRAAKDW